MLKLSIHAKGQSQNLCGGTIPFLFLDLHLNLVLWKWNSARQSLNRSDVQMEINEIAAKDKFEAGWSENTKEKVASSFLSFMRKAGFFSDGDENLVTIRLEDAEFAFYLQIGEPWFLEACLLQPYEINRIKTECLMRNMTLEELYDKLCSEEFKNTENNIFYNFFIYQYPPQEEYAMRKKD